MPLNKESKASIILGVAILLVMSRISTATDIKYWVRILEDNKHGIACAVYLAKYFLKSSFLQNNVHIVWTFKKKTIFLQLSK